MIIKLFQLNLLLKEQILATHHLVEQMPYVKIKEEPLHVDVSQTILVTHMLPAGLNVQQMQNVHPARHVKTCIVLTPVQLPIVESMLSVKWSIIFPTVSAYRDILETHLHHVANLHLSSHQLRLKIPAIPILVDQTAINQDRLEKDVSVHASLG